MPRFIDVGHNRVRPAEEVNETALPGDAWEAMQELHGGSHHWALPLGSEREVETAHELAGRSGSRLQITGSFLLYVTRILSRGVLLERALYGPDGMDAMRTILRYWAKVEPYTPSRLKPDPLLAQIRESGQRLVTAVATLEDGDVRGSEFDALYVPKAWEELTPLPGILPEDYAVTLAAGVVVYGMTGPQYNPN